MGCPIYKDKVVSTEKDRVDVEGESFLDGEGFSTQEY